MAVKVSNKAKLRFAGMSRSKIKEIARKAIKTKMASEAEGLGKEVTKLLLQRNKMKARFSK